LKQWLVQHAEAFRLIIGRIWRAPLAMLMMLGVIGATLSLPAILYVAVDNLSSLSVRLESEPQISLFLSMDIKPDQLKQIDQRLRRHAEIREFRFIGREKAWQELQQTAGLAEVAGGLEQNPLPDAYIVRARSPAPADVERLQQELAQWEHIDHVQLDAAWIKRLYALLELGRKAVMVLGGLLGFALVAVIGNTIRLQILTQREEIEVSKLIGATDRFIRRPFLYAGALTGMGGGIAAWLILYGVVYLFNRSVEDLGRLYASDFHMGMLGVQESLVLISGAVVLGWIGAYVAVSRYLSAIEPD
jgi:cell division transport system permease protein